MRILVLMHIAHFVLVSNSCSVSKIKFGCYIKQYASVDGGGRCSRARALHPSAGQTRTPAPLRWVSHTHGVRTRAHHKPSFISLFQQSQTYAILYKNIYLLIKCLILLIYLSMHIWIQIQNNPAMVRHLFQTII